MSEIQGLAPPDTSPEKAIPIPSPPGAPKLPSASTLRAWAPLYLSKADKTLSHLSRVLSTPSGTDTFLLTLGYTTLTASQVLASISLRTLQSRINKLLAALTTLPANTTILITDTEIPTSRSLRLSQSLRALSSLISDFRIFARLWGLLGIYRWGKGVYENPPQDIVQRRIAWAQVLVNVAFQYLENGAYLASKGVLGWDTKTQNKAWNWSSRFWAAHVGLEFWRLAYELRSEKGKQVDQGEVNAAWRRSLISNMAWAPLTMHWSLEAGLINDLWVGIFGSVAGVVAFKQVWKNTAL